MNNWPENIEKEVDRIIKYIGMDHLLEGMIRNIDNYLLYSPKESYLVNLRNDIRLALERYRDRYKDVNGET